jgi:hypothetical protein
MNILYGNQEGRYFTQWRFDELVQIAGWVNDRLGIVNFYIWYDAEDDFHRMSFWVNNINCQVSFYKIFRLDVNGGEAKGGVTRRFQRHESVEIPNYVKELTCFMAFDQHSVSTLSDTYHS